VGTYVFHGDRGGVGKSMLATAFGEYLLGKGRQVAVVETDTQNGDVGRYFEGAGAAVHRMNLRTADGWIEFLSYLQREPSEDIIVALPAGIGGVFTANAGKLLSAVADLKRTLAIFWLMNRTADSIALLAPVTASFQKAAGVKIVAVRNLYFGEPGKFDRWNDGKVRKSFLSAGGMEMDFEDLQGKVVDATFAALPPKRFSSNGESGLGYGEMLFLRDWLERTTATFDGLAESVGVGKR
jgi:hypothetical protein